MRGLRRLLRPLGTLPLVLDATECARQARSSRPELGTTPPMRLPQPHRSGVTRRGRRLPYPGGFAVFDCLRKRVPLSGIVRLWAERYLVGAATTSRHLLS